MICKACNKVSTPQEEEDCFEKALYVLQQHYKFYKNALHHCELELQQVRERNENLNKALQILQKNQQPAKRFKSQQNENSWLDNSDRVNLDVSITDDEPIGASNLNIALNSEQLFDTSALSPSRNENIISSSEYITSPRIKESPKRNKQRDELRRIKDCSNKTFERFKSERHIKERNSQTEKSWAMKFLKPNIDKSSEGQKIGDIQKTDKKLYLSLKKPNPSKMKQTLIHFNKSKDEIPPEGDNVEDIIEASPVVSTKSLKSARSWAHRSGPNHNSNNTTNSSMTNAIANVKTEKDNVDKTMDDIVFDFSPTKKRDSTLNNNLSNEIKSKQGKFDNEISTDCISLPNEHLGITTNKSDSSSVVILTPNTQDIIFVDDTCNNEPDIDTMDLWADIMKAGNIDNLENLKKYESKSIRKQQAKELDTFKKPQVKTETYSDLKSKVKIKQDNIAQDLQDQIKKLNEDKPSSNLKIINKPQNPLLSSDEQDDEDDGDFMPKPFIIKQEQESSEIKKKQTIKERFKIDCENCEKLINFLDDRLTDEQIQQHLDKCKHHNTAIIRQNTPQGFWNPFILSFQTDDPRNEVLIDTRFKDNQ